MATSAATISRRPWEQDVTQLSWGFRLRRRTLLAENDTDSDFPFGSMIDDLGSNDLTARNTIIGDGIELLPVERKAPGCLGYLCFSMSIVPSSLPLEAIVMV